MRCRGRGSTVGRVCAAAVAGAVMMASGSATTWATTLDDVADQLAELLRIAEFLERRSLTDSLTHITDAAPCYELVKVEKPVKQYLVPVPCDEVPSFIP